MDEFIDARQHHKTSWYQQNLAAFLRVCDQHARVAIQHHDQLVTRFIVAPSATLDTQHLDKVTASGPPLPVLVSALEKLRDRRAAAPRTDIRTRHSDIQQLRASLDNTL
jgi:hypothetical protein